MEIRNCQFKFKCTKVWSDLAETSISDIRYCTECDKGVHYCDSDDGLRSALSKDWCIAIKVIEKEEDTFETVSPFGGDGDDDSFIMMGDLGHVDDSIGPPVVDIPDDGN